MSRRMMFGLITLFLIPVFIGGGLAYYNNSKHNHDDDHHGFHIHAGFQIYVDGQMLDLSSNKYMNFAPCTEAKRTEPLTVKERIHLHENIGNVAHIHEEGVVWRELFESLNLQLAFEPIPVMFINGENAPDLLNTEVGKYDSVIFIFGAADNVDTIKSNAVTEQEIIDAENAIESCGV